MVREPQRSAGNWLARRQSVILLMLALTAPAAFASNKTQVVVVPVANMYSAPSERSDVVSQVIYGSNLTLLLLSREWSRI